MCAARQADRLISFVTTFRTADRVDCNTVIFLMGYGLVSIPRTLWRLADVRGRQRLTCHKAGVQARKALDAHK